MSAIEIVKEVDPVTFWVTFSSPNWAIRVSQDFLCTYGVEYIEQALSGMEKRGCKWLPDVQLEGKYTSQIQIVRRGEEFKTTRPFKVAMIKGQFHE